MSSPLDTPKSKAPALAGVLEETARHVDVTRHGLRKVSRLTYDCYTQDARLHLLRHHLQRMKVV